MDINYTCPLGSKCTEIKDGELHRCAWLVGVKGKDAQGNEHDEEKCAIAWNPVLMLEISGNIRGTNASIQDMRNLTVERQDAAIKMLTGAGRA
jgi:hypothetical protein